MNAKVREAAAQKKVTSVVRLPLLLLRMEYSSSNVNELPSELLARIRSSSPSSVLISRVSSVRFCWMESFVLPVDSLGEDWNLDMLKGVMGRYSTGLFFWSRSERWFGSMVESDFPFVLISSKVLITVSVIRSWVSWEPPTIENSSACVIRLWPSSLSKPTPNRCARCTFSFCTFLNWFN